MLPRNHALLDGSPGRLGIPPKADRDAPERLALQLSSSLADCCRARRAVEQFLASIPIDAERAYDFTLAIAEAVNNAAEHAYSGRSGFIDFTIETLHGEIVAVVRDQGTWRAPRDDDRGRGLDIMHELTDRCGIACTPNGTTITLALDVHVPATESTTS